MKQIFYFITSIFFLTSCLDKTQTPSSTTKDNQNILDTFPLPQDQYLKFTVLKTADEYFQSACNRMSDWPGDSLSTYICIREYQNAIKLDSNFWHAYRNLSRSFSKIKRDDLAIKAIDLAFKHCGDLENAPELFDLRGKLMYRQHKFDKAIPDFQKLIDMGYSPLADRYYWLALSTLKNGDKAKAKKIISDAKDVDFKDYNLGQLGL